VDPVGRRVILHHFMHPNNPARAGHAWLCVPPFEIVDLTVQAQPGFTDEERRLLRPVLADNVPADPNVSVDELVEPEYREMFHRERGHAARVDDFVSASLHEYWQRSPSRVVTTRGVRLKYIECGIMAMARRWRVCTICFSPAADQASCTGSSSRDSRSAEAPHTSTGEKLATRTANVMRESQFAPAVCNAHRVLIAFSVSV
jgi:hypothetical protein